MVTRYPNYSVFFQGIGAGPKGTEKYGECSQMAVFTRRASGAAEERYGGFFIDDTATETDEENTIISSEYICKFCKYNQENEYDFISYGVCTHFSYSKTSICENVEVPEDNTSECVHLRLSYKTLGTISYPVEVDTRTRDEIILDEALYRVYRLGSCYGLYYDSESEQAQIPLYELTTTIQSDPVNMDELRYSLSFDLNLLGNCLNKSLRQAYH